MVDSQRHIPTRQSENPLPPHKYQDFYLWLRSIPLGVLQDLYKQYHTRRGASPDKQSPLLGENIAFPEAVPVETLLTPIALRRSVFVLIFNLLAIEIFFDLLYVGLRIPPIYFQIPQAWQQILTPAYFVIFVGFNILKFILIIAVACKWVTNSYVITKGEIRYKNGIFSHNEKIYVCTHAQEVTYTQSLMGKICNFGSIEVYNPAIKETIYLDSIPNPKKYVEVIKKNIGEAGGGGFIVMQQPSE